MGNFYKLFFCFSFLIFTGKLNAQILTFDFVSLAGSEVSANSNFNDPGLNSSTITRGSGLTASANAGRFNATNWALTSIANAVTGNNYMEFTLSPLVGNQFSVSSIVVSLQRSGTGPSVIALRSSVDGYVSDLGGQQAIVDNTSTQTFTFTFAQASTSSNVTYRIYMYAESTGGSGGPGDFGGDDIIVNGVVSSASTITTSAIAGSPFNVTCTTSDAVNVDFTSTGTFNAGNVYTAELSDATGSFASPTTIGTLASTANSGTIVSTIPANTPSGTLYRIRVVSDNPVVTGTDNGTDLTITLTGPACGITTGTITGSPFTVTCNTFINTDVPFSTFGIYNGPNIFKVQLSDASGSFAFPITIGTLALSGTNPTGSIPSTILAGLTPSTTYRIRVVSTDPVETGTDNGIDLTVNNAGSPCYGPIVINEISQGSAGNLEYMELLVVANDPCATMDIRNFIIDDNNGDFSGGAMIGAGIAGGHIRFTNSNQWANVPSGSLILIYNEAERNATIPADDPSDLIVPDKVYILAADNSLLEGCVTRPTSTDNTYSPCTYGIGVWNYISMANGEDAAQVRYPNGTYSHGFSWGGAPMDGGPDVINIGTTSTSGQNLQFENTVSNDYTDVNNFGRGTVPTDETPGAGNSAANTAYINSLICTALPVELSDFNVLKLETSNYVFWNTFSEINTSHFVVERSSNMIDFFPVHTTQAAGNSNMLRHYAFADDHIENGTTYYRLKMVDLDGEYSYSPPKAVTRNAKIEGPILMGTTLNLINCDNKTKIKVFDVTGKLIEEKYNLVDYYSIAHFSSGLYIIQVICQESEHIFKIAINH